MDINNIAIVRVTNVIPLDGIVYPVSEAQYLQKYNGADFEFSKQIFDLLNSKGFLPQIDFSKISEDYLKEIAVQRDEKVKEYLPYLSDYNSMVLWALNGIVPDDKEKGFGNNIFSNKTCAIIDGLAEQMEQSEIVSLEPTDAAIKGKVKLSKQATILIKSERYENLTKAEKEKLESLNLKIKIFEGSIQEAIKEELEQSGRYTAEKLSLTKTDNGFIKSETSDELIQTIASIATEKKIAQERYFNIITRQSDQLDKLENVKNELENSKLVKEFYKKTFFTYLFSRMDINTSVKSDVLYDFENPEHIKSLCDEIERIGIDEYKKEVDTYNLALEELRRTGKLPTPQQIIDAITQKKEININGLIEEVIKTQENQQNISMMDFVGNAVEAEIGAGEVNLIPDDKKIEREGVSKL